MKATYKTLTEREMEAIDRISALPRPGKEKQKRQRPVDVEEVEDPPHTSKRVAGPRSVCMT